MSALRTGVLVHQAQETATTFRDVQTLNTAKAQTWERKPDKVLVADVEIWIDWAELLRQMAPKAIKSKGGRSNALRGALVVKALNRQLLKEHNYNANGEDITP